MGDSELPRIAFVYRIAPEEEWETARMRRAYYGGKIDEKFIHLSTALQVPLTLKRFYHRRPDLFLLKIDVAKIDGAGDLKWECADGDCFPHYYGSSGAFAPLPLEAVAESTKLELFEGEHSLPTLTLNSSFPEGK